MISEKPLLCEQFGEGTLCLITKNESMNWFKQLTFCEKINIEYYECSTVIYSE